MGTRGKGIGWIKRNRRMLGLLLAAGMVLTGCGNAPDGGADMETGVGSETIDNMTPQSWTMESGTLYAQYQGNSMDKKLLGTESQLIDLQCMATADGVYAAGARANQGVVETAVYQVLPGEDPELLASFSEEKLLCWCRTEGGLAFLGMRVEGVGEEQRKLYTLYSLAGERLEEQNSWPMNDALSRTGNENADIKAIALYGEELMFTNAMGNQVFLVQLESGTIQNIPVDKNIHLLQYGTDGTAYGLTGDGTLYAFDAQTGGREIKAQNVFSQTGYCSYGMMGQDWILVGNGNSLFAVSLKDGSQRSLLDYTTALQPESSLWFDESTGEGTLVSWDKQALQVDNYYLSAAVSEEDAAATEKEVVTFASFLVDEELQRDIVLFNQSNDQYWIEVETGESTGADYTSFNTRLQTQLMTGQGPDLLSAATNAFFPDYVEKGALEDLLPYIQRDLNPEDYVQAALHAYEKDGGIYALGQSFVLTLLAADSRYTGGTTAWTFRDMGQAMQDSGASVINPDWSRGSLLAICIRGLGSHLRDYGLIRDSILFAEKYGIDGAGGMMNYVDLVLGEDALTKGVQINSPLDIADLQAFYGENLALVGNPVEEGSGIYMEVRGALSINTASDHKEGAWAFIRFLLEREKQFSVKNSLPMSKEAYEAMMQEYLSPFSYDVYLPEAGGIVTFTRGHRLVRSNMDIDAITAGQAEELNSLVDESEVLIWTVQYEAESIIWEEAEAYYQGDRSIDQVMETIESRMEIWFGERE